jgi:3-phenylpropionate/trans-cinnamate dioxygenase ferredoxin reductase subunit
MREYKYIIIGGGMTGDSAVKGIREIDKEGEIAVISRETNPPYNRPPLTKDLWKDGNKEKIWRKTDEQKVDMFLETEIESVNPADKVITDSKGLEYKYEKLLLATGGITNKLPFGEGEITYYRLLNDYEHIKELTGKIEEFTIIGSGFIGSELAASLSMNGKKVKMVYPDELIGERIFPRGLAEYVTNYYKEKGVELFPGETVKDMVKENDKYIIITESGKEIKGGHVIAGLGIKPDLTLAQSAGVKTENGIIVDEFLCTNVKDIYSAGDAANFYNPLLDKRIRIEHADNAVKMGKAAGLSMAGKKEPYDYLPFFYSDLFDLGYEAIGDVDSKNEIYEDWQEQYKKGVIYYCEDDLVKGVLLWNVWSKVNDARELIASKLKFQPEKLKGKIT